MYEEFNKLGHGEIQSLKYYTVQELWWKNGQIFKFLVENTIKFDHFLIITPERYDIFSIGFHHGQAYNILHTLLKQPQPDSFTRSAVNDHYRRVVIFPEFSWHIWPLGDSVPSLPI